VPTKTTAFFMVTDQHAFSTAATCCYVVLATLVLVLLAVIPMPTNAIAFFTMPQFGSASGAPSKPQLVVPHRAESGGSSGETCLDRPS